MTHLNNHLAWWLLDSLLTVDVYGQSIISLPGNEISFLMKSQSLFWNHILFACPVHSFDIYQLHCVNSHAERPATLWSSGNLRSFPAKNVPVGRWKDDFLHDCWRCSVGDTNVLMFSPFPLEIIHSFSNYQSEIMDVHSTFALEESIFLVLFWAWKWSKCSGHL